MNRRESFKAMNTNVIVLPKRDLNYKLKLVSNEDWEKRFEFFWALAWEKTQMRHNLPPFLSRNLCGSLLCSWPLFSLFSGALCISFSLCSSLDIRLFTYAFSFFFPSSSPRFLLILASFLTFLRVFLDSLDAFYLLLSLAALYISFQPIFTQNPLSTNLNYNNFQPLTKL